MKVFSPVAAAVAAVFLFNACNLAPEYHQPAAAAPAAYKETNGWQSAQPGDALPKGKWWEVFQDPQLNALEESICISNQNVVAAVENFHAARALFTQARAAYYPTATLAPSVLKSQAAITGSGGSGSAGTGSGTTTSTVVVNSGQRRYTVYELPADASWQPDLFDSLRNTAKANAYTAQGLAATVANVRLSAQAGLAQAYFNLRGQDELIDVFSNTVKAYEQSVSLTTTLFQTGIDSQLDQAQAIALLETIRAQAAALGITRAQYEHSIAVYAGRAPSEFSIDPIRAHVHLPNVPLGMPADLLQRRPDVANAERAVAAANAQIGVARAAWFPDLSLTGSIGYQKTSIADLFSPPALFWTLGATLTETVIDFGRRRGLNEQAWANYRSTAATYRQTVLEAIQQVEDQLAALKFLASETTQEAKAVAASQKSLDLSMERYRLGVSSYLNVITAQETLLGNQQAEVTARTQQYTAAVQLILALGGGWERVELPASNHLYSTNAPAVCRPNPLHK